MKEETVHAAEDELDEEFPDRNGGEPLGGPLEIRCYVCGGPEDHGDACPFDCDTEREPVSPQIRRLLAEARAAEKAMDPKERAALDAQYADGMARLRAAQAGVDAIGLARILGVDAARVARIDPFTVEVKKFDPPRIGWVHLSFMKIDWYEVDPGLVIGFDGSRR